MMASVNQLTGDAVRPFSPAASPWKHAKIACMLMAGLFVLGACGGPGVPEGTVTVSLRVDVGSDLGPAGVPVEPGGAVGVSVVELRVFGGEGELFFDADGNVVPNGGVPVYLAGGSVTLHLPRATYAFEVEGRDADGHVLAVGSLAGVEIMEDTSVDLPLLTLVGSVEIVAPSSIVPNEIVDVHLLVHPPDRPDLLVPTSDFTVSYEVDTTVFAESGLGVRFGVECQWMSVSATVTGLADGSQAMGSLELAPHEVCSQYAGPVGVDLIPPLLVIDDLPAELELGESLTLTGTVSELQTGVASVTLFDGPVEVGSALVDTTEQPHVWSVVWTPSVARDYELLVVAADLAGNESQEGVQISVVPPPEFGGFTSVIAGGARTCGLDEDGNAYCWGDGRFGLVGDGTSSNSNVPVAMSGGYSFVALTIRDNHACGVAIDRSAYCWGLGDFGKLGNGSAFDSLLPVAVAGGHEFVAVAAGASHTCGLVVGGGAYCWGHGEYGRLGDGSASDSVVPVAVAGGQEFVAIAAGAYHTCGLVVGGAAYCWGVGANGQLGAGEVSFSLVPVAVAGEHEFVALAAGTYHTCGVVVGGAAYCWGRGREGSLGDGSATDSPVPVAVAGGHAFVTVAAGFYHTCGLVAHGAAFCWGEGGNGQLGDGSVSDGLVPVAVSGNHEFVAIDAGAFHTCGIGKSGSASCWGYGAFGQLGNGLFGGSPVPVEVNAPQP